MPREQVSGERRSVTTSPEVTPERSRIVSMLIFSPREAAFSRSTETLRAFCWTAQRLRETRHAEGAGLRRKAQRHALAGGRAGTRPNRFHAHFLPSRSRLFPINGNTARFLLDGAKTPRNTPCRGSRSPAKGAASRSRRRSRRNAAESLPSSFPPLAQPNFRVGDGLSVVRVRDM